MRWHAWAPIHRDNERMGSRLAFGEDVLPLVRLDEADVIVSLDSDFLASGPTSLQDARAFSLRRDASGAAGAEMNRLYVLETMYTLTGAAADHRMASGPAEVEHFARLLARAIGLD